MGAIAIFKELIEWVLIIPKLVQLNANQRQEIRDAVGSVADELIRGLDLVIQRIEGAKRLAQSKGRGKSKELKNYTTESTWKLAESFSEFKICRGLREKRDHFKQIFHPARASVRIENMRKVEDLLSELETDERMIIDEVGPILNEIQNATSQESKVFIEIADQKIKEIQSRKAKIRALARKIHDKL